jgi:hypothetical protein
MLMDAPGDPGWRQAGLPRGGTLVVRTAVPGDLDGLSALYARLDAESRYRRFFSSYRPNRAFFERMVAAPERGGVELVAEVSDPPGEVPRIVAEAGYEMLANGDGELAITVDGAWRGWLGPYLLDALLEAAGAAAVPNLEADILATNGPMLALLRARGHATLPTGDWTTLRAIIGTTGPAPVWPGGQQGLRILVEGAAGDRHTQEMKAAGLHVIRCPGTTGRRPQCPALVGEPCPLASGADAIIVTHPPDTDAWHAVRTAHPQLHPGVPVCVDLPLRQGEVGVDTDEIAVPQRGEVGIVALVQRLARDRYPAGNPPLHSEDITNGATSS